MRFIFRALAVTLCVWALAAGLAHAETKSEPRVVAAGGQISIEYTLKLADGSVADTNVGGQALKFEQGKGQILPALDEALLGLAVGDSKKVSLSAAESYGEVDPALFETVPIAAIPEEAREIGTQLVAESPTGQKRMARVHEVTAEEVTMNLNHPLAGQALNFEVKILEIE